MEPKTKRWKKEKEMDMLRRIGIQSGESMELVPKAQMMSLTSGDTEG